MYVTMFYCFV